MRTHDKGGGAGVFFPPKVVKKSTCCTSSRDRKAKSRKRGNKCKHPPLLALRKIARILSKDMKAMLKILNKHKKRKSKGVDSESSNVDVCIPDPTV